MRRSWGTKTMARRAAIAAAVTACAGLLGACAETKLAVHTAKTVSGPTSEPRKSGTYKVGNPYQIAGTWYYPKEDYDYREEGVASWYGPGFHGQLTANGETYDQRDMTAAHRTLPLPSMVRVTNLDNGRSLVLRINDRGPFAKNRIIDISERGAQLLDFVNKGTARVRVEILAEESLALKRALLDGGSVPDDMPVIAAAPRGAVQGETLAAPLPAAAPAPAPIPASVQAAAPQPAALVPLVSTAAAATPPASPAPASSGIGTYVQAGAFSDADNVRRLEAQLNGVAPVVVTPVEIDGRKLLRVRLGPIASDAEAERVLAAVQAQGLPGARVVRE
ncbi:septal ring lytic transglycosylase RlpA family protein [Novispirillum sp. DQ9]|uniref:septal ring lytic transglycosylase RlpA family protein n=1 Tax=Novispirillum sp. DQ9 TaxID=3398612 RepID=UPI003C7D143A